MRKQTRNCSYVALRLSTLRFSTRLIVEKGWENLSHTCTTLKFGGNRLNGSLFLLSFECDFRFQLNVYKLSLLNIFEPLLHIYLINILMTEKVYNKESLYRYFWKTAVISIYIQSGQWHFQIIGPNFRSCVKRLRVAMKGECFFLCSYIFGTATVNKVRRPWRVRLRIALFDRR